MHLEQLSITEGFSKLDLTFVAKSFLETGVAAKQLHDVYEMLFRQKVGFVGLEGLLEEEMDCWIHV